MQWVIVQVDLDKSANADEFDRWYSNVHLPELLDKPGFIRAWRGHHVETHEGEGRPRFLAVYEVESVADFTRALAGKVPWDGIWAPHIRNWSKSVYDMALPIVDATEEF